MRIIVSLVILIAFASTSFAADATSPDLVGFAKGLATQLSTPVKSIFIKTEDVDTAEIDDRIMGDAEAYVNISSILFSGLIRYATDEKLDLLLLTSADSYDGFYMSGVELGVRPHEVYGLRLGLMNDENHDSGYKMQLELYPSENSTVLVRHISDPIEDGKETGIELKLDF